MTRLYLTAREYEALLQKQDGVCCVKGCGSDRDLIAEHSTPHKWKRAKPDQLMCSACHKNKDAFRHQSHLENQTAKWRGA